MSTTSAPIRIGYCLSLTGPVAGNSRSARLAHDIWREDVNGRGGLLGRPVELICCDDRADASLGYRRNGWIGPFDANQLVAGMAGVGRICGAN